jgi:alpha-tubulin suppressor-like RCC1 family protein
VRCWGSNDLGQLGTGYDHESGRPMIRAPERVPIEGVVHLAAAHLRTCALLADASVACWGTAEHGETGAADAQAWLPTRVGGLPPVRSIALGGDASCAITRPDGEVLCWGKLAAGDAYAPERLEW